MTTLPRFAKPNRYLLHLEGVRVASRIVAVPDLLDILDSAIRHADHRIEEADNSADEEYFEALRDDLSELVEDITGLGLVACQSTITAVCQAVLDLDEFCKTKKKSIAITTAAAGRARKTEIQRIGFSATTGYSPTEILDAGANYFKHKSEWKLDATEWKANGKMDWGQTDSNRRTIQIVKSAGVKWGSSGNCRQIAESLGCGPAICLSKLAETLNRWTENVIKMCGDELLRIGVL